MITRRSALLWIVPQSQEISLVAAQTPAPSQLLTILVLYALAISAALLAGWIIGFISGLSFWVTTKSSSSALCGVCNRSASADGASAGTTRVCGGRPGGRAGGGNTRGCRSSGSRGRARSPRPVWRRASGGEHVIEPLIYVLCCEVRGTTSLGATSKPWLQECETLGRHSRMLPVPVNDPTPARGPHPTAAHHGSQSCVQVTDAERLTACSTFGATQKATRALSGRVIVGRSMIGL